VVEVNKTVPLSVIFCGDNANTDNTARMLLECDEELPGTLSSTTWSVNGNNGGNSSVGIVTARANAGAVYHAPDSLPAQNPVSVSAEIKTARGKELLVSTIRVIEHVSKYEGTFSGMLKIPFGGYHQVSANVRFTYEPRDEDKAFGDRTYVGTGKASVNIRPISCNQKSGSADVDVKSELKLIGVDPGNRGPLAGTYNISIVTMPTMTLECGVPPQPMTITYPASIGVGGDDKTCAAPRLEGFTDEISVYPFVIKGSWSCNIAQGASGRANWTLRALN
jgi:hypothetical protein